MSEFTSNEIKVLINAIEFYKYEMNKTDNMNDYRSWKSLEKKIDNKIQYHHGVWSFKDKEN